MWAEYVCFDVRHGAGQATASEGQRAQRCADAQQCWLGLGIGQAVAGSWGVEVARMPRTAQMHSNSCLDTAVRVSRHRPTGCPERSSARSGWETTAGQCRCAQCCVVQVPKLEQIPARNEARSFGLSVGSQWCLTCRGQARGFGERFNAHSKGETKQHKFAPAGNEARSPRCSVGSQ